MILDLFDPANVGVFARFVVAGYLILSIRNAYVLNDRAALSEVSLDILLYSLLNQMVWVVVVYVAGGVQRAIIAASSQPQHFQGQLGPTTVLLLETLVLPLILGGLLGYALRHGAGAKVAARLAMPMVGSTKRTYDAVFSSFVRPGYIVITLEDETVANGYFGTKSHAGRDPARSEIFLEEIFSIGDNGQWQPFSPPRSALISLAKLRSIEFIDYPRKDGP